MIKLICASLLVVILFLNTISSSEALTISEKRLKVKLATPIKQDEKISEKFVVITTPNGTKKAVSIEAAQKVIVTTFENHTKKPKAPKNETIAPEWKEITQVKVIGIKIDCKGCAKYSHLQQYEQAPKSIGTMTDAGRIHTKIQNNPEWLRALNQTITVLDPPQKIAAKSQMIYIVSQIPADAKIIKGAQIIQHTRLVDAQCRTAHITGNNLAPVLFDTINYLKSDCTRTTLATKASSALDHTDIDLTKSPAWQELKKYRLAAECARTPGCSLKT